MPDFTENYFKTVGRLITGTVVTDASGVSLGLEAGVARAVGLIAACEKTSGKVIFIGNGGSAGIASHMAIDFWKNGRIRATAFNDPSLLTCLGNDYGYSHIFEKPIEMFAEENDLLVAISSSGRSENILFGVSAARAKGCGVITMSGFGGDNPLRATGDVNFYVASGAYGPVEVIHQSFCHCLLDAHMVETGKLNGELFK